MVAAGVQGGGSSLAGVEDGGDSGSGFVEELAAVHQNDIGEGVEFLERATVICTFWRELGGMGA